MQICPGKESIDEALSVLRLRSENMVSFKANGRCLLQYYAEGKKYRENFSVKLWVNPPTEVYLQGDVAFDPQGIVLGCNEREFWLAIKPKEISSYWYGEWPEGDYIAELMVSPKLLLEAFAPHQFPQSIHSARWASLAEIGAREHWSLSNEGVFDVLIERNEQGATIKKIYIYCCDYLIRRIEYFQANGEIAIVTELDGYKQINEDFSVPSIVRIARRGESVEDMVGPHLAGTLNITIRLKSIKSVKFTPKQQSRLFTPPQPKGFKHIYRIIDGNVIENTER